MGEALAGDCIGIPGGRIAWGKGGPSAGPLIDIEAIASEDNISMICAAFDANS